MTLAARLEAIRFSSESDAGLLPNVLKTLPLMCAYQSKSVEGLFRLCYLSFGVLFLNRQLQLYSFKAIGVKSPEIFVLSIQQSKGLYRSFVTILKAHLPKHKDALYLPPFSRSMLKQSYLRLQPTCGLRVKIIHDYRLVLQTLIYHRTGIN